MIMFLKDKRRSGYVTEQHTHSKSLYNKMLRKTAVTQDRNKPGKCRKNSTLKTILFFQRLMLSKADTQ